MDILCFMIIRQQQSRRLPNSKSHDLGRQRSRSLQVFGCLVSSSLRVWEFQSYGFSFHTSVKAPGITPQFWNQSEFPEKDKIPSAACVWARIGRLRYDGLLLESITTPQSSVSFGSVERMVTQAKGPLVLLTLTLASWVDT